MQTVRPHKTVDDAIAKYDEKTQAAGADWLKGVLNPKRLFTTAGIAAFNRWVTQIQAAIANQSLVKGLQKVDLAMFDAIMNALGPQVYTTGVKAKLPKVRISLTKVLPAIQQIADGVNALPNVTDADRENRMLTQIRNARKLKGLTKR